eukprot:gene13150-13280_t
MSSTLQTPVAFQGSAALLGYYTGVVQLLQEKQLMVPGVTVSAGLSGGAYTMVLAHLGMTGREILKFWHKVNRAMATMRRSQTNAIAQALLDHIIPQDIGPDAPPHLAEKAVTHNARQADLISTLLATDHIPCIVRDTTYTILRNNPVIDGGYANGFREMCPNGNINNCIKVGSWHVEGPYADGVCDKRCGSRTATSCKVAERNTIVKTLYPTVGQYVDQWPLTRVQMRCPASDWQNNTIASPDPFPLPDFVPQNSTAVDIHPGKYNPLPEWPPGSGKRLLACEWQNFALAPPWSQFDEFLNVSYTLGYQDARGWYAATHKVKGRR